MLRETADVVLRGGATVHVRPVVAADEDALADFLGGLSPESRYFRFFGGGVDVRRAAARVAAGSSDAVSLVAVSGPARAVVGLAELAGMDGESGEVAFAIADSMQGQGLGTVLLAHLAQHARAAGLERLVAYVMPGNVRMANVFRHSGFEFAVRSDVDGLKFEAPVSLDAAGLARFEERVRVATCASVARVLRPASVAVVGADAVQAALAEFPGRVVDAVEPVDLVVVGVPAAEVLDVARAAAAAECGALLVLSTGFAEIGAEGAARQRELVDICRDAGMRLVGPNCLGVANTAAGLNATPGLALPRGGNAALLTQSGALGIALLEQAAIRGLGLSSFVSVGNKADLSGNDLLQFWESDASTDVVLLYLESFGNPRNFARIARRMSCVKPIVAVKSGRTPAGERATASHTGSLLAASDVSVDALFRQSGVVRASTLAEFLDVGALLSRQPLPAGPRVCVLTDAGGPGVLAADACVSQGLTVPEPSVSLRSALSAVLPPESALVNPINLLATAAPQDFTRALSAVAESGEYDAVIAIAVHGTVTLGAPRAGAGPDSEGGRALPVLVVQMAGERAPVEGGPPVFRFPESAARALARVVEYARWRAAPRGEDPVFDDARPDDAAVVLAEAAAGGTRWLDPSETATVLSAWGLPVVPGHRVGSVEEVVAAAEAMAGPVAVKAIADGAVRKSSAGGVYLDLAGGSEAGVAARAITAANPAVSGFLVQPMIHGGAEMLVGVTQDPLFGPVVACGPGGERAELERDVAVRLTPVTSIEAASMVRELRTFPVLDGWKGAPRLDVSALEDLVMRLAALADTHPEVREIDLDPVKVLPRGAAVLDARIRVGPPDPEPLWPAIGASPPRPSTLAGPTERWPSG